ncbi:MAG: amidohydrolase [Bacteroidota bacterium]
MRKILLISIAVALAACSTKKRADLVVHHGKIYTVDSAFAIAEAFAIKDGKIVAVGSNADIEKAYEADSSVDAGGKAVYPGFIDAHSHFVGYGRALFEANLYGCKSWDEVVSRIKEFAAAHPGDKWIRGRGWDQNAWPTHAFPVNTLLNDLFPGNPVLLQRIDGHAAIANAKALELAGIQPGQPINGGTIVTEGGKLTGVLVDNAVDLVNKVIPKQPKGTYEQWLMAAQEKCFAVGLTTVSDCGLMQYEVDMVEALQKENKLLMRLYVMLSDDTANFYRYLAKGPYKTDRLFVKGVKAYADGALGSRGACLLSPYNDQHEWRGFLLNTQSHFDSLAQMLANTDFQLCTHAIGDSGNRVILGIYNKYLQGKNDKRWRIEHAQVVNQADFELFGKTSVIPSVQPVHATSDMYWAKDRLGEERLKGGYAYKQLLQQNGWLPLGTDFPVEDIPPVNTFYAAVIRKDSKGFPEGGFQPENALTREQALRGMTIWAAKAGFLEEEVGSIEVGKKADFVIMDKDLMAAPEAELLGVKCVGTFVGGRRVYGR